MITRDLNQWQPQVLSRIPEERFLKISKEQFLDTLSTKEFQLLKKQFLVTHPTKEFQLLDRKEWQIEIDRISKEFIPFHHVEPPEGFQTFNFKKNIGEDLSACLSAFQVENKPNIIKIKSNSQQSDWAFVKSFDNSQEIDKAKSLCVHTNFWGFSANFIPVRTNRWKNFACDFFLPSVTRSAIKIDCFCIKKIFFRMLEIAFDFMTFPFRVVTVIPRAIYNSFYPKEKDPFYLYLKSIGAPEDLLKEDSVFVRFESENEIERVEKKSTIGFIALPLFPHFRFRTDCTRKKAEAAK